MRIKFTPLLRLEEEQCRAIPPGTRLARYENCLWVLHNQGIAYSSDRGEAWENVYRIDSRSNRAVSGASAFTAVCKDELWCMIGQADEGQTAGDRLAHSYDGGQTWNTVLVEPLLSASDICFLDKSNGWILGQGLENSQKPRVLRTRNGGVSWTGSDVPSMAVPESMCFIDSRRGWCALGDSGRDRDSSSGFVFETLNGGASWVEVLKIPSWPHGIRVEHGRLVVYGSPWCIWSRSVLRGRQDDWAALIDEPSKDRLAISVSFGDEKTGLAFNNTEGVIATADGGQTWVRPDHNLDSEFPLDSIDFSTPRSGFAMTRDCAYSFSITHLSGGS